MAGKKPADPGAKKKNRRVASRSTSIEARPADDLSPTERDLVSHLEQGWQLETDSLGANPLLRNVKSDEVIRPLSANRSTVKGLEIRGLIVRSKGDDPLTIVWLLKSGKGS